MKDIKLSKPLGAIVRDIFPDATDEEVDGLLWNRTGYPCFWRDDPEKCIREDLSVYKATVDAGKTPCDFCNKESTGKDWLCDSCRKSWDKARRP